MNNDELFWATGFAIAAALAMVAHSMWVIYEAWR